MEIVAKLFGKLLVFVYHCLDEIGINGYLSGLSRPEQVVYLFRQVVGVRVVVTTDRGGTTVLSCTDEFLEKGGIIKPTE